MATKHFFDPDRLSSHPRAEAAFVAALAYHQNAIGLSDLLFARQLAVAQSTWRHTKAGRLPLGWKLLMGGRPQVGYDVVVAAETSLKTRAQNRQSGGDAA